MEAVATVQHASPQTEIESLFKQHSQLVLRAAYRVTGNMEDAEDVLQTVFLRLSRREIDIQSAATAPSYLHRAAVNCAIDLLRSRSRLTGLDGVAPMLATPESNSPERAHSSAEIRGWLRRALATMHPKTAEIFTLRYIEGHKNQEIAEMLATTPSTIGVSLSRARDYLQKEFLKFTGESDE